MPHGKKQWIITILVVLALVGGGFAAYAVWLKPEPKPAAKTARKSAAKPQPKPEPIFSNLTGMPIADASLNDRPVTGVMIENSPDSRPQSGIDQAGVLFEAVAEGGITRFLTLYQENEPSYIGPVRSVRPYYLQWLLGFDAPVAHVGGSADALRFIKEANIKDLDQFHNPGPYHRISSRYAPHNMYSNVTNLRELAVKKGWTRSNFTSLQRKTEAPGQTATSTSIDLAVSSHLFNPHYDYDAASNSYKRSIGGKPHMVIDGAGNQTQLAPKVVVGLVMPKGANGIYSTYQTIGSGPAMIFQDGIGLSVTWHKTDNNGQFTFTDANNQPVRLNPGQTWFTVVGTAAAITAK